MKYFLRYGEAELVMSPLAEGRELKCVFVAARGGCSSSPLAEGRELKWDLVRVRPATMPSPLAEGRELK